MARKRFFSFSFFSFFFLFFFFQAAFVTGDATIYLIGIVIVDVTAGAGRASNDSSIQLSYGLGSIPLGTGRLYCQDVARGATNRSRGSEVQDLQPTGARASPHVGSTCGSQQSRRNRCDS